MVIKEEAKLSLSGQIKLGAGLPQQYDVEANTVLFNKKYKGLNVLEGNNIGNELGDDLIGFNSSSVLSRLGMRPINNLLSLGTIDNPPLAKSHYFMNNSAGINANNLFNFKNKWQLKTNIQTTFDKSSKDFSGKSIYENGNDSFGFDENQHSDTEEWRAAFDFTMSKNMETAFSNNSLSLEYEKELSFADIGTNNSVFALDRSHKIIGFKNQFDYVPALKNGNIIQFSWFTNYGSKPQRLMIKPGVFTDILNEGLPYTNSIQHVEVPSLFSNMSLGYRLSKGKITQYYAAGLSVDDQKLRSHIELENQDNITRLESANTNNHMNWLRAGLSLSATYGYTVKRFTAEVSLPIILQQTMYKDRGHNLNEKQSKLLFSPSASARYALNLEEEFSFSYERGNSFGNINNVYRGLIIQNYRTISNNSAGINESLSNKFGLNYKAGKTMKLMFYNVGLTYNKSLSSTMLSNRIDDDNTQTELVARENEVKSYGVTAGFDKFIFSLGSTLKMVAAVNLADYNQLFNDELLPFQNISYNFSPSLETRIWKKINLSYSSNFLWTKTNQVDANKGLDRNTFNLSQNLGFPITLFPGCHLRMSVRHLFSHQPGLKDISYIFMDSFVRYRPKKWNTDLELNITNIGNIKNFETYNIAANMQTQNTYELRGRMVVLRAVFNFR